MEDERPEEDGYNTWKMAKKAGGSVAIHCPV